jgi:hypothetical protein
MVRPKKIGRSTMIKRLLIVLFSIFCATISLAQEEDTLPTEQNVSIVVPPGDKVDPQKFKVGPGMEITKVKGANIIAPKDTRVYKQGSQIIYEDIGEYLGRRFDELEKRIQAIENEQSKMKEELKKIKQELENRPSPIVN